MITRLVEAYFYNSSADLPRSAATSARFFNCFKASKVALMTLCGLVVPIDLVRTFWIPAEVITARTAPPAITPVPSGAGLSSTMPEPNRPSTVWGIVVCVRLTLNRFFLADSIPLRMACGTSLALPEPKPTTAALGSPTTTSAAKERFLPPLTTFVTRLMDTTWSLSWKCPASSFFVTVGILYSRFLRLCSRISRQRTTYKSLYNSAGKDLAPYTLPRIANRLHEQHQPKLLSVRDTDNHRDRKPPC